MTKILPSRSLHGTIVHELGRRIVKGTYPEGSKLPIEEVLREELDVSRNALREAIKALTAKGLLVVRTRTGTLVQPKAKWHLTDPDVLSWALSGKADHQLYSWLNDFRKVIEPAVAAMAAVKATDEQKKEISARMDEVETVCIHETTAEVNIEDYVEADMAFHNAIFEASANPFLQSVAEHISQALANSRKVSHPARGSEERALPLHRAVADAIVAGNEDQARQAMLGIFDIVEQDLNRAFANTPE